MAGGWFLENYMWTQTENLRSDEAALRVVKRLDLQDNAAFTRKTSPGALVLLKGALFKLARLPFGFGGEETRANEPTIEQRQAAAASRMAGSVRAEPVRNTRLISVTYTGPDAALAAQIANTLTEEFIEQHLEGKYDATTRASDFLRSQLDELQIQVEQSEQKLLDYAKRNNIVNLSERETIARKRLADLSDELTQAETELITQKARYDAASQGSVSEYPEILKSEGIRRLEQKLSEAKSKLAGFSSRYGPEWPAVKETRLEIEELENQLLTEKRRALHGARQDYELAQSRYEKLSTAVDQQRALVDDLNESSIQYNILQREVDTNKELYEGLLQRLKEAGIAAGLRSSNIRIADTAKKPTSRSSPRRARTLMLALILGLFVGTGTVFLIEALDNTLTSSDDVTQHLGLPALGVVPSLGVREKAHERFRLPFAEPKPRNKPHLVAGADDVQQARALEAYRS